MVAQPTTSQPQRLSPDEYLERERAAEAKSEYIDGALRAMSGASPAHVLITANIVGMLYQQLRDRPCRVYGSDLKVRVGPARTYVYPDIVAVCDQPEFGDGGDVLLNPALILEVLSPSTEAYDRGRKFRDYIRQASLREYVLVSQDSMTVERYSRQGDLWVYTTVSGPDGVMELPSIGCQLALRDVYDKVGVRELPSPE